MGKEDGKILVVRREALFSKYTEFNGFVSHGEHDFEDLILHNSFFTRRGKPDEHPDVSAEANEGLKQPIMYVLIVNPQTLKVFAYRRTSMDEDPTKIEKRLAGKWSWGVGGHIEDCDMQGNFIHNSMRREVEEEVDLIKGSVTGIRPLGYIHDLSDDVGRVHFGLLYAIETDATDVRPKSEASRGIFCDLPMLLQINNSQDCTVENWSKIALEPLQRYFEALKCL
jgi:predicted NUDIX family phosphoesterase